jgi:hypothetical protein
MNQPDSVSNVLFLINRALPIAFAVLLMEGALFFFFFHKLLTYLKERHFNKWEELGSPSMISNNTIKNDLAVSNFFRIEEYLIMNDPYLIELCKRINTLKKLHHIVFAANLMLFAAVMIAHRYMYSAWFGPI